MITKQIALQLKPGTILLHKSEKQGGGAPYRVRVTGQVRVWVKRPDDFRIPVKHGLYTNGEVTQANGSEWEVEKPLTQEQYDRDPSQSIDG